MKYKIIEGQEFVKIKKEIQKAKAIGEIPLVVIEDDSLLRKFSENEKNIFLATKLKDRKDKLYQRDSGFDDVTLKFMAKNNIAMAIILDELINNSNSLMVKAKILARIKQNIKIARKKKTRIKLIILDEKLRKDEKDLLSLLVIMEADTKTAKQASEIN